MRFGMWSYYFFKIRLAKLINSIANINDEIILIKSKTLTLS